MLSANTPANNIIKKHSSIIFKTNKKITLNKIVNKPKYIQKKITFNSHVPYFSL